MSEKLLTWQKYENLIENQVNSPILDLFKTNVEIDDDYMDFDDFSEMEEDRILKRITTVSVPDDIHSEIYLTSNFDCWMAHTNFDITPSVKSLLDRIEGVEVLRVCTRYRFFVGVGRLFDFKDVADQIHKTLDIAHPQQIPGSEDEIPEN